jgi:type I restriction-modification system DNA methylase subunit
MKQTIELHKRWKANPSKGEVFTPSELVREMLDEIPTNVWENPESMFLDPCMGKGTFLIDIVTRLINIYGYSQEDAVSRVYGYDTCVKYVNHLKRGGLVNVFHKDFLNEELNMKFDVIVGNPPYNNNGKIKGTKQTSGTSLWLQFLKKIPSLMNENGICSLIVPAAVGNTNSLGWKALKEKRVISITTGINEKYFNVGTSISNIVFKNQPPTNKHLINGVEVNRDVLQILPNTCNNISLSIMEKISSLNPMNEWNRNYYPEFINKSEGKQVVGMSFLDRSEQYKVQTKEELMARNLNSVNICWIETEYPSNMINLMKSKLFNFYSKQTMLSGNLSVGMVRALSIPKNWCELKSDNDIFQAYGLTTDEINYVESYVI